MKRSLLENDNNEEFSAIYVPEHIQKIKSLILGNVRTYFDKIYGKDELDKLALLGKVKGKDKSNKDRIRNKIDEFFAEGLRKNYEKEYPSYYKVLGEEHMEEHLEDNPKNFRNLLKTDCPIVRRCYQSKSDALKDWQKRWASVKAVDLLDTVANVVDFAKKYYSRYPEAKYSHLTDLNDFSDLSEFNDDEYKVPSVIGSGIKSIFTYYMYPAHFHMQVRKSLYGLFFLSGKEAFDMHSRSNEFLMINDVDKGREKRGSVMNYNIDHNYWYPYDLFMFYSKIVYDEMKRLYEEIGGCLEPKQRYTDLYTFMLLICDQHQPEIDAMMGGSDAEII